MFEYLITVTYLEFTVKQTAHDVRLLQKSFPMLFLFLRGSKHSKFRQQNVEFLQRRVNNPAFIYLSHGYIITSRIVRKSEEIYSVF